MATPRRGEHEHFFAALRGGAGRRAERREAMSELTFNWTMFWHTMVFESLPPLLSAPLCCLLEGRQEAINRTLMGGGGVLPTFVAVDSMPVPPRLCRL